MTTSRHPDYTSERIAEWRLMRDTYEGESKVKARTTAYLPKPDAWTAMSDGGVGIYGAYITRARFPEITNNTIRGIAGVMHGQDWQIELPAALEYLKEKATPDGLTLDVFSRRVSVELLTTGRYAVLTDAPAEGGDPYLVGYAAEALVNWDEGQDFFVLEESINRRTGSDWNTVTQTRQLELIEGAYVQTVLEDGVAVNTFEPRARGGGKLPMIPIAVGGAMDMDLCPDSPPLIGVARAAIAHYQLNADYRMALYMAYQDTLFIYNASKAPTAVGAGTVVSLTSAEIGKDVRAEYVAPSGNSIQAHERAMDREQMAATRSGAQMFDNTKSNAQESGDARRLRFSAETATIQSIANASAAILEKGLRNAAIMVGANPDDVIVTPPRNMLEGRLDANEINALVTAWERGAFGYETLYDNLQRGRIASPERTAEEEEAAKEAPLPEPGIV